MSMDWYNLPHEMLDTWNAEWSDGSGNTIHELTRGLQSFVNEQMRNNLQVSSMQLGTWLGRNGWMKERVQKKDRWTKGGQSPHAPWYIDFTRSPVRFSNLAFTKGVIFVTRDGTAPRVYWEVRHFAKALKDSNENFNMYRWWGHQRHMFEKLRKEFNFDALTLRPCRMACVKLGNTSPTMCTKETLLDTNGLIVMLLRCTIHSKPTENQKIAKDVLNDLLHRLLSKVDAEDELWGSFTSRSLSKGELMNPLTDGKTSTTGKYAGRQKSGLGHIAETTSGSEAVAERMICVFANRKKCEKWWTCLIDGLKMLEERITTMVLTGKVGQISSVIPSLKGAKRATELSPEIVEVTVQEIGTTVKSADANKGGHDDVACQPNKRAKTKSEARERAPELTAAIEKATVQRSGTTARSAGSSKNRHDDVAWNPSRCGK